MKMSTDEALEMLVDVIIPGGLSTPSGPIILELDDLLMYVCEDAAEAVEAWNTLVENRYLERVEGEAHRPTWRYFARMEDMSGEAFLWTVVTPKGDRLRAASPCEAWTIADLAGAGTKVTIRSPEDAPEVRDTLIWAL